MAIFSDKFVAYLDILGFGELVTAAEDGSGIALPEILNLLTLLGKGTERAHFEQHGPTTCPHAPYIERNLDFRVTQISDCVIISSEVSPAGVINLVSHCWGAVIELLSKGITCRGYITRGMIYHTDTQFIGSGYQKACSYEKTVCAFPREAKETGTPYTEVDSEVVQYIDTQPDPCVKTMFGRMVKRNSEWTVLFPFQRLQHSFIVAGGGREFDPERERTSNRNLRAMIGTMKERVRSFVGPNNTKADKKVAHYIAALDAELQTCDKTDEMIDMLSSTAWRGAQSQ